MHGHATRLDLSSDGSQIIGVRAATTPGHGFNVVADDYVLACGGLENARLLLASNDVEPRGIGNGHGNVGRYYMTHLMGVVGGIELSAGTQGLAYGFERDAEGVYCRRRIWVTPEAQKRAQTANAVAFLYRPNISDAGHRSALFSSTYLAKAYVTAFRRRGPRQVWEALRADRSARREHWLVVLKDLPRAVPEALRLFQQRWLTKRRLPSVLGRPGSRIDLFYHTEHVPNPESRVELDTVPDDFGMPRLRTHIAFSPLDFDTVVTLHEAVARRLTETGLGVLRYHDTDVRAKLADHVKHFNSQGHHLGTTRMSARPEDGVVDPDCRVHGLANLYIAGGSVFPTGGHANPTLTIVALAARLADHLRNLPRSSEAGHHDPGMTRP
jgi:choline dehydrogenase-like flavoprotein